MRQIDLTEYMTNCDPNVIWDKLYENILAILRCLCPIRTIKLHTHSLPFVTVELTNQIYVQDRAFRKARKSNSIHDWRNAKTLRTGVRRALIAARCHYINCQLNLANGDSKKFWQTINKNIFNSNATEINSVYKRSTSTKLFGAEAANEVNDFFAVSVRNYPQSWISLPACSDPAWRLPISLKTGAP